MTLSKKIAREAGFEPGPGSERIARHYLVSRIWTRIVERQAELNLPATDPSYIDAAETSQQQLLVTPKKVATQKAIDTQHAAVFTLECIAQVTEEAKRHYANLAEAA